MKQKYETRYRYTTKSTNADPGMAEALLIKSKSKSCVQQIGERTAARPFGPRGVLEKMWMYWSLYTDENSLTKVVFCQLSF